MSPGHWNAETEGGPRNGVMTALEDFLDEHDRPHRLVVLPLYYGLAIVADGDRLDRHPSLASELDRIESAPTKDRLIELGEGIRLRAVAHAHTQLVRRDARIEGLASRYLDSVVRGLVDEYYLENEVRLDHLLDCVANQRPANEELLRDPVRHGTTAFENLRARRRTGIVRPGAHEVIDRAFVPSGRVGLDDLGRQLDRLRSEGIGGDLVVCGAGAGGVATFLRAYQEAHDLTEVTVWVADRFDASLGADLNQVRDVFDRFGVLDHRVRFLQGDPAATLVDAPVGDLCLLYLEGLDGADARAALDHLYPRLAPRGAVVVGGGDPRLHEGVVDFRADHGVVEPLVRIGLDGASWTKAPPGSAPVTGTVGAVAVSGAPRAPLAPPAQDPIDLSVVVVFYDMKREAARSLHSLSRAYQVGLDGVAYEVVVVENGSNPDERLGPELVAGFGPEFRYLDMGEEARPSPAHALNRGIAAARGRNLALMIDGAHVLTPGVLRYGLAGLRTYAPAVVATQAWYVGPGQQGEAMRSGYDEAYEDRLFEQIRWPEQGYRLFEIGHFQGDRDWLEGVWESNCLFVDRAQLEQVGGFDEGFDMAGGGYANLDLYERLAASPEVEAVTILGEGSFHQVHGGTTTNLPSSEERRTRIQGYARHYAELRGRPFIGPEKPLRYVGAFETVEAKRTRARRMTASAFDVDRALEGDDGPLGSAAPVPEDLRDSFTKAYWRSHAWRHIDWIGHPVHNAATDLVTYQEIVTEVRPDWIVDTGTRNGGRAWFLATILDLVGHGQVVSVGRDTGDVRPEHPRTTYVDGAPQDPEVVTAVRSLVEPGSQVLLVLGTRGKRNRMRAEFDAYADLVSVGSYAIVEHTMLNGWPVDGSFGKGPFETVRAILATRTDFVVDHEREKQSLTFNPYGFLRRIA